MKSSFYDMLIIEDWSGNTLFQGMYYDKKVQKIMKLNDAPNDDIYVSWVDLDRDDNPYEFIIF